MKKTIYYSVLVALITFMVSCSGGENKAADKGSENASGQTMNKNSDAKGKKHHSKLNKNMMRISGKRGMGRRHHPMNGIERGFANLDGDARKAKMDELRKKRMEKRAELLKVKTANCPTGVVKASNPGNPVVVMETNMGKIELELFKDKSPISVENFLKYIKNGHYSGTIFHRIKSDFMIQGGGFTKDKKEKTKDLLPPIKNEADNGLVNKCGTISMARTNVVDSATAQFFINVVDNNRLNHRGPGRRFGYAVFGQVLNGMDVVNKIKNIPTVNEGGPFVWMPSKTVEILKVTLKK